MSHRLREILRTRGPILVALYVVLLGASHLVLHRKEAKQEGAPRNPDKKLLQVSGKRLAYLEWGGSNPNLAPLILIHGSPGRGARDWTKYASELAASGEARDRDRPLGLW